MRLTINGVPCTGRLDVPRVGAWTAELSPVLPTPVALGPCTVVVQGEMTSLTLAGCVTRADAEDQTCRVRVVGGRGGLTRSTVPRAWVASVSQLDVASAILSPVGESADATATPLVLPRWTLPGAPATEALSALLSALPVGSSWRVEPSGAVRVGAETWAPFAPALPSLEVSRDDAIGLRVWALEDGTIWPGRTILGERVEHVAHVSDEGGTRTHVYVSTVAGGLAGVRTAIASAVSARVAYLASYPATVVAQRADGTLDVRPDDVTIPPVASVPIRYGVPGVRATVRAGSRVALTFEGGKPSAPVATIWDAASVAELTLTADAVKLGAAPTEFAALASRVDAAISALTAWCTAHTHPVASALASASTPPPPSASSVASSTVRVTA